jgi:DNA-binding NarL/FixJ family response regulator
MPKFRGLRRTPRTNSDKRPHFLTFGLVAGLVQIMREVVIGKQGLEMHKEQPIDLVITDIFMPEKEGTETIIALRCKDPDVAIIGATAA